MTYYSFYLSKNSISIYWPLKLLKGLLEGFSTFLFLPIFYLFVSTFKCVDKNSITRTTIDTTLTSSDTTQSTLRNLNVNYIVPSLQCFSGVHVVHFAFGVLFAIILLTIACLVTTTLFETKITASNPHSKLSSSNDQLLLFSKAFFAILFSLFGKEGNSWILICFLLFISIALLYFHIENHPHNNTKIYRMYLFSFCTISWANVVLLIGQIFKVSSFNGCLPLFFVGIPIIFLIVITTHKDNIYLIHEEISHLKRPILALKKIQFLIELINKKDVSRKANVLLKGYIYQHESNCSFKNCPLKRFIESVNKNEEVSVFLLQHIEYLFVVSLSKFPNKVLLRISYSLFLMEYLNKKQQANQEITNCEIYANNFEESFIIYRTRKLIEEQTLDISDNSDYNQSQDNKAQIENNVDIVASLSYKKYLITFKNLINKASLLYIDFWSLLLNPNQDSKHLTKLNDFGTKINATVGELKVTFEKIQKVKHNDKETICYYSDFLNDILNDKEQAIKLKLLIESEDSKPSYDDNNYFNLDLVALSSSDEYQYIVISGKPETFGIITNISLGVCLIFGYSRNELVGKTYDVFMPEVFQKMHRQLLYNKVNDFKKDLINYNGHVNNNKGTTFKTIKTFGRNKARYLVPLIMKVTLINTEINGISFVAKVYRDTTINSSIPQSIKKNSNQTCFILTNNYLIIQNFTANSLSFLGLNSNYLNNTVEISSLIKQFHEEILKYMIDSEATLSPEQKMSIKRQIIASKFKNPSLVNWKNPESGLKRQGTKSHENQKENINKISEYDISEEATNLELSTTHSNNVFYLTIKEAIIGGKQEGYIFKFDFISNPMDITNIKGNKTGSSGSLSYMNNNKKIKSKSNLSGINLTGAKSPTSPKNTVNHNSMIMNKPANNLLINMHNNKPLNLSPEFQSDDLKSFIPAAETKFQFDPNKISYLLNPVNSDELKENIKKKAIDKIKANIKNTENESEEEEEESEERSSDEDDEDNSKSQSSSFNSQKLSDRKNSDKEVKSPTAFMKKRSIGSNDENLYYKVTFDKIKYSVYDFTKKMIVEQTDYEKISQVECKKYEDVRKKVNQNSSDNQGKSDSSNDQGDNKKAGGSYQFYAGEGDKNDPNSAAKLLDKKSVLMKQIEYSLLKQEAQPAVTTLKWFDFLVFILLIGATAGFLYLFYYSKKLLVENFLLLQQGYKLVGYSLYSIANIRELTLLANKDYEVFLSNRDSDITQLLNETNEYYFNMHTYISYIITTFLPMTPQHSNSLFSDLRNVAVLKDDLTTNYYKMPLASGFIEVNTAIFHIVNDIENFEYYPSQIYIYFFMENSNNEIFFGLEEQVKILGEEMNLNIKNLKNITIYCLVGLVVIIGLCYFMMSFSYNQVAILKESYLEVFFEIGTNVIKGSLEKCEKFTKKMQSETFSEFLSNFSDDNSNTETDNSLFVTNNQTSSFISENSNSNSQNYHHRKRAKNDSTETLLIKIYFLIFLVLVYAINLLFCLIYISKITNLKELTIFYQNQNEIQLQAIKFYNYLRDFIFDPKIRINGSEINTFFDNYTSNYYSTLYEKEQSVSEFNKKFPGGFTEKYYKVYHNDLCPYLNIDKSLCEVEMFNSTNMGYSILLSNFVEEIRSLKTDKELMDYYNNQLEKPFTYNFSLFGTSQFKDYINNLTEGEKDKYEKYNPFRLYSKSEHKNLKSAFYNLIKPANTYLFNEMTTALDDYIRNNGNIFIYLWYGYGALIIICYVSIWKPFEFSLSDVIFKTKNMLSIIPKEVLANVGNIQKLLGINQNAKKAQDKGPLKKIG